MIAPAGRRGPFTARRVAGMLLAAAVAATLLFLYREAAAGLLDRIYLGLPLALLAGLAGFAPRRRWRDAAWLALPVLAANAIEQEAGSQALICLALPWFALTRRPRFAILAGGSLLMALLLCSQLKTRFAGSRLTWQDIQFFFAQFADNIGVVASQPTVAMYTAGAVVFIGLVVGASWWLDGREGSAATARAGWAASALSIALVIWSGMDLRAEARRASAVGGWRVAQIDGWSALPISNFLATAALKPRWMPPPVDTSRFRAESHARVGAAGSGAQSADVLLFLQESQMNPLAIAGCPPEVCRMAAFGPSDTTRAFGPMRVHVFGAGTWLSEFSVVTGVPHTVFGDAGTFSPFNVAPGVRQSFVRSMRAAGYRTVAVYPVRGGMMNARTAYAGYGFDHFYDATELGLDGAFSTSDDDMHRVALEVLDRERRHGKPVLMFVITIFNHGEHGRHMERVPSALRELAAAQLPVRADADNLADYVWRTQEFQRVMDRTRRALLGGPRPAVLAWYGDHQPTFGSAASLRERIRPISSVAPARFLTWYEVGSNLGGRGETALTPLDLVFLPGLLAQFAGVPLDDWLAANVTAREQCGGLFEECRVPAVRDAYLSYLWRDLKAFDLP